MELELIQKIRVLEVFLQYINRAAKNAQDISIKDLEELLQIWFDADAIAKEYAINLPDPTEGVLEPQKMIVVMAGARDELIGLHKNLTDCRRNLEIQEAVKRAVALRIEKYPDASLSDDFVHVSAAGRTNIQSLLEKLRGAINVAEWDSANHKDRVLRKLNALQSEFDKEVSDYERLLGGFVSLGDSIGIFAKKSKPATDSVIDIIDSLKAEKRETRQIGSEKKPLQIEDKSGED